MSHAVDSGNWELLQASLATPTCIRRLTIVALKRSPFDLCFMNYTESVIYRINNIAKINMKMCTPSWHRDYSQIIIATITLYVLRSVGSTRSICQLAHVAIKSTQHPIRRHPTYVNVVIKFDSIRR